MGRCDRPFKVELRVLAFPQNWAQASDELTAKCVASAQRDVDGL